MNKELHTDLKALGNSAINKPLYEQTEVNKGLLEKFPSPFSIQNKNGIKGIVSIEAPEFSSLCPKTGQPDTANIRIYYEPDEWCVESKSLKLYLYSFRNYGSFMEAIINTICNDLVDLLQPNFIRVTGGFAARGGIPLHPIAEWSKSKAR